MTILGGNADLVVLGLLLALAVLGAAVAASRVSSSGPVELPVDRPSDGEQVVHLVPVFPIAAPAASTTALEGDADVEPSTYPALAQRQFAKVADNPEVHVGEPLVAYGEVTQFDAATGPTSLLARTGGSGEQAGMDEERYAREALFSGSAEQFGEIAEGDSFKAFVTVAGTGTYEAADGQEVTVPRFVVDGITVYWWSRALAGDLPNHASGERARSVLLHQRIAEPALPRTPQAFLDDRSLPEVPLPSVDDFSGVNETDADIGPSAAPGRDDETDRAQVAPWQLRVLESKRLVMMAVAAMLVLAVAVLALAVVVAVAMLRTTPTKSSSGQIVNLSGTSAVRVSPVVMP